MSLHARARADAQRYTTNGNEWGDLVRFVAPGGEQVSIYARTKKVGVALDGQGIPINSKVASVTFSEMALSAAGYVAIRDTTTKEVNMDNHKVSWKDSTGVLFTYRISECFPDETLGVIVATLTEYSQS